MPQPLQPLLHDSVVLLSAPSQAWSADNGDMGDHRIHGFYHSDVRIISELRLSVGDQPLESIQTASQDATTATFVSLARHLDGRGADPRIRIDRTRSIGDGTLDEKVVLSNARDTAIETTISVRMTGDFSQMQTIKAGMTEPAEVRVLIGGSSVSFTAGTADAVITADRATVALDGTTATATWAVTVAARDSVVVSWRVAARDTAAVVSGVRDTPEWAGLELHTGDSRLSAWVDTAMRDLDALRMVTKDAPDEVFLAAGAPWFFTLFGRDSIWAARFLLPLGTGLAASTLRILARLQGTREVAETAEQPGKIMHELRPGTLTIPGEEIALPPLYYGTVDATSLWITLLHDAWIWGMPDAEVEPLLSNLEAALAWMRDYGDSDGDGFLEYVDTTGHGLANQGWKDSGDSIQWRDGTLAEGPIALCEVQAYAYEAAIGAAAILEHFGRPAAEWRGWAAALKQRFAEAFWIDAADGAYPAVALDASKRRVDTVTSNIGHLLGTGILEPEEAALVARRLVSPELNSGYGLRTMSTDSAGFWPLSYHGGSVWTHDTAIAIGGLAKEGFHDEAFQLADGLLRAAEGFDYRMPELYSGDAAETTSEPVPYPAACRPQAWAAAAAITVLGTALGLEPDGTTTPIAAFGAIEVKGLRR